jgi:hypothetical protein
MTAKKVEKTESSDAKFKSLWDGFMVLCAQKGFRVKPVVQFKTEIIDSLNGRERKFIGPLIEAYSTAVMAFEEIKSKKK